MTAEEGIRMRGGRGNREKGRRERERKGDREGKERGRRRSNRGSCETENHRWKTESQEIQDNWSKLRERMVKSFISSSGLRTIPLLK